MESKVLTKLSVVRNDKWINQSVPGAWELTDEICKKISKSISNKRWITDGVKNRYINKNDIVPEGWRYGRSGVGGTKQWKQRLSEAQSKVRASEETKAKLRTMRKGDGNSFWGKTHSKESLDKMSKSHKNVWAGKAKHYYLTPWGKFISTTDAAKSAPYKISAGMIWTYCFKYSDKYITANMKISKSFPEYIGKQFKEVGFGIEKL